MYSCGEGMCGSLGLGSYYVNFFTKVEINNVKKIYYGEYNFIFILKNSGEVYSCGNNVFG